MTVIIMKYPFVDFLIKKIDCKHNRNLQLPADFCDKCDLISKLFSTLRTLCFAWKTFIYRNIVFISLKIITLNA